MLVRHSRDEDKEMRSTTIVPPIMSSQKGIVKSLLMKLCCLKGPSCCSRIPIMTNSFSEWWWYTETKRAHNATSPFF